LTYCRLTRIIRLIINLQEGAVLAKKNEPNLVGQEPVPDIKHIQKRLNMLDQRLDNIDSVVTAVVERVMRQPLTFNITCSNCGHKIEIALIGIEKPKR